MKEDLGRDLTCPKKLYMASAGISGRRKSPIVSACAFPFDVSTDVFCFHSNPSNSTIIIGFPKRWTWQNILQNYMDDIYLTLSNQHQTYQNILASRLFNGDSNEEGGIFMYFLNHQVLEDPGIPFVVHVTKPFLISGAITLSPRYSLCIPMLVCMISPL